PGLRTPFEVERLMERVSFENEALIPTEADQGWWRDLHRVYGEIRDLAATVDLENSESLAEFKESLSTRFNVNGGPENLPARNRVEFSSENGFETWRGSSEFSVPDGWKPGDALDGYSVDSPSHGRYRYTSTNGLSTELPQTFDIAWNGNPWPPDAVTAVDHSTWNSDNLQTVQFITEQGKVVQVEVPSDGLIQSSVDSGTLVYGVPGYGESRLVINLNDFVDGNGEFIMDPGQAVINAFQELEVVSNTETGAGLMSYLDQSPGFEAGFFSNANEVPSLGPSGEYGLGSIPLDRLAIEGTTSTVYRVVPPSAAEAGATTFELFDQSIQEVYLPGRFDGLAKGGLFAGYKIAGAAVASAEGEIFQDTFTMSQESIARISGYVNAMADSLGMPHYGRITRSRVESGSVPLPEDTPFTGFRGQPASPWRISQINARNRVYALFVEEMNKLGIPMTLESLFTGDIHTNMLKAYDGARTLADTETLNTLEALIHQGEVLDGRGLMTESEDQLHRPAIPDNRTDGEWRTHALESWTESLERANDHNYAQMKMEELQTLFESPEGRAGFFSWLEHEMRSQTPGGFSQQISPMLEDISMRGALDYGGPGSDIGLWLESVGDIFPDHVEVLRRNFDWVDQYFEDTPFVSPTDEAYGKHIYLMLEPKDVVVKNGGWTTFEQHRENSVLMAWNGKKFEVVA
ncbi:MAG: hypothetical protein MI747_03455, partial [Desulfobacterales bacterium]|nr:hypothetical protein [Desulfobacterales bacterium]